ncbi:class I SAM-dependent DNA methyltransferase [Aspergillus alliaceus]|uniref:class I SAM-dependent DNA methyltransferase n=1 Tax=Petromyces alliaceus TaxID=209559 RepID=UPI0012A66A6A|nr:S-adenosyl-L-methionine-dependent methyltransferase [Aspergillus alliaceus]KAB8238940.1 S-adenosyl-L-methionine-dependent methyltransferase [Aspergillus alliaceus]
MSTTQVQLCKSYLREARDSVSVYECMEIYDKWAATYNDEVGDEAQDYVAPELVAQAVLRFSKNSTKGVILDAGCGTGLVGQALVTAGATAIDGLDFSPAMLTMAKKTGVYRKLIHGDLTCRINVTDEAYNIVVCVGTFTLGHVGSHPALREFVRITRTNGIVAATILQEVWVPGGFQAEVEALAAEGQVDVVFQELIDYVKGHGDKAMLVILKKTTRAEKGRLAI